MAASAGTTEFDPIFPQTPLRAPTPTLPTTPAQPSTPVLALTPLTPNTPLTPDTTTAAAKSTASSASFFTAPIPLNPTQLLERQLSRLPARTAMPLTSAVPANSSVARASRVRKREDDAASEIPTKQPRTTMDSVSSVRMNDVSVRKILNKETDTAPVVAAKKAVMENSRVFMERFEQLGKLNHQLQQKLTDAEKKIDNLESNRYRVKQNSARQTEEYKQKIAAAKEATHQVQLQLTAAIDENKQLKTALQPPEEHKQKVAALRLVIQSLQQDVAVAEEETRQLKQRLAASEHEHAEKYKQLQQKIDTTLAENSEVRERLQQPGPRVDLLRQNERLQLVNRQLKAQLNAREAELKETFTAQQVLLLMNTNAGALMNVAPSAEAQQLLNKVQQIMQRQSVAVLTAPAALFSATQLNSSSSHQLQAKAKRNHP